MSLAIIIIIIYIQSQVMKYAKECIANYCVTCSIMTHPLANSTHEFMSIWDVFDFILGLLFEWVYVRMEMARMTEAVKSYWLSYIASLQLILVMCCVWSSSFFKRWSDKWGYLRLWSHCDYTMLCVDWFSDICSEVMARGIRIQSCMCVVEVAMAI